MNINPIRYNSATSFRSYNRKTEGIKGQNKVEYCISESYLMRNLDSAGFATDYTIKNLPNGANIAIEGCSQMGAFTWATLFHKANKNKIYKITGYDIVPEVIEDAKLGVLNIGGRKNNDWENFLVQDFPYTPLTEKQKEAKALFEECFEKTPRDWRYFNVYHPRYKHKVKRFINPGQDIELVTKQLEYIHQPERRTIYEGTDFIPKKGAFDNIIDFKVSDFFNINQELKPESTAIVSLENGLYHLLGTHLKEDFSNVDLNMAEQLFKKIHSVLLPKGLFVCGVLSHDHLCSKAMFRDKCFEAGKDEKFEFCDSPIHNLLKKLKFEPIFYDFESMFKTKPKNFLEQEKLLGIYLPSVWKKI